MQERTNRGLHDSLVREVIGLPRATPILDLGCGSGAWLERLRQLGFTDLTGVDASPPPGCIRANLDRDDLSLGRRFGLITAIEVIEHMEYPARLLDVGSGLLDSAGKVLITTPNVNSLRWRVRYLASGKPAQFDEKGDPTHVSPIFCAAFERLVARRGLRIERTWTYPERGTQIFGAAVNALSAVARLVVPDRLPGDNLCMLLAKVGA